MLYVAPDGDVVLWGTDETTRLDVAALPDGGIVRVDADRYALYGGRTDRYEHGARIRVYGTDGTALATGPVYGPRWRHQLCVAPFRTDGTGEFAVVRKPHVDRTVEFYWLDGDVLSVTATRSGYASHRYGSRNLGGGLAVGAGTEEGVRVWQE